MDEYRHEISGMYGCAVHEAGHALVAWALGERVRKIVVGVKGDETAGRAETDPSNHLPPSDQIAICAAGSDAQFMLAALTNDKAAMMDMNEIRELIEDCKEAEGDALRYEGRAWEGLLIRLMALPEFTNHAVGPLCPQAALHEVACLMHLLEGDPGPVMARYALMRGAGNA
ncbi:M50 family metallopeptidase [Bradyrhizobium sp. Ec3.3]|uniref:M50 family metallopeptidase n=1 Tax=Bradyrhizobium sp. Ec3.3 TaxID=189753 RepID=UPI0004856A20|nr:M50 family metallopeptidase [Bradyrhizobium sp. Ec3.3]